MAWQYPPPGERLYSPAGAPRSRIRPWPWTSSRSTATLTFDVAARRGHGGGHRRLHRRARRAGCPALDLRQPVDSIASGLGPAARRRLAAIAISAEAPGAEMRVLDRVLDAGSRHRLELAYRLATPDAAGAQPDRLGRRGRVLRPVDVRPAPGPLPGDVAPGQPVPRPLRPDRRRRRGRRRRRARRAVQRRGPGAVAGGVTGRIDYPAQFTSLSPMLVVAPATGRRDPPARRGPARAGRPHRAADRRPTPKPTPMLAACEDDIAGWLTHQAARYGPWAHGTVLRRRRLGRRPGHGVRRGHHRVRRRPRARGVPLLVRPGGQAGPGQRRLDRRGVDELGDLEPAGGGAALRRARS